MKEYTVKKPECGYNLALCDYLLESASKEGFALESVRSFGHFNFSYAPDKRDLRYFAYIKLNGQPFGRSMRKLYDELNIVFQMTESVRIGTKLCVYRFEPSSKKEKTYLNTIAARHGLEKYTPDDLLAALRRERDVYLRKNYLCLAIILGILTAFFTAFGIIKSPWIFAPGALSLAACVSNIVKYTVCR